MATVITDNKAKTTCGLRNKGPVTDDRMGGDANVICREWNGFIYDFHNSYGAENTFCISLIDFLMDDRKIGSKGKFCMKETPPWTRRYFRINTFWEVNNFCCKNRELVK